MDKLIFTIIKSEADYQNTRQHANIFFSNKSYDGNCIILNALNLFEVFNYIYKNYNCNYYCYINSKCRLVGDLKNILHDSYTYLNYYEQNIFFIKYNNNLYKLYELFEGDLNERNFLKFLCNCFFCLDGNINFWLENKIVYPKHKLIYNTKYEKFKNKKHKSN